MVVNTADNRYGVAQLIVAPTLAEGANYTTIASALTAASSGQTIFIRPGTYTENLTLKAGVNLTAFDCDAFTPNVTIVGKCSATFAGAASISGIRLQTNSDYLLEISGTEATVIDLINCYINVTNNTAINYTTTSVSAFLGINSCAGNLTNTGIAYFVKSSPGRFFILSCRFRNDASSTTASTISNLGLDIQTSWFLNSITNSGASVQINNSVVFNLTTSNAATFSAQNSSFSTLTTAGTGSGQFKNCSFDGDTAPGISIGAGTTVTLDNCYVQSSNTNPITGAGTLVLNQVGLSTATGTINPTTITGIVNYTGISRSLKQPLFEAVLSSSQTNKTGAGAEYVVICDTEIFDQGANYNNGTGVFTAPVTGRYLFTGKIWVTGCTVASGNQIGISTSNRVYYTINQRPASASDFTCTLTTIADMDAADTCSMSIIVTGEAGSTDDILGSGAATNFCGQLIA